MQTTIPPLPSGTVGLTVAGPRTKPFAVVFGSADVEAALTEVERRVGFGPADRDSVDRHVWLRARTRERIEDKGETENDRREIGQALLWCALHHPTGGAQVRSMVAHELLDCGRANISAAYNEARAWAWGVSRDPIDASAAVQGVTMGRGETIILSSPGSL